MIEVKKGGLARHRSGSTGAGGIEKGLGGVSAKLVYDKKGAMRDGVVK